MSIRETSGRVGLLGTRLTTPRAQGLQAELGTGPNSSPLHPHLQVLLLLPETKPSATNCLGQREMSLAYSSLLLWQPWAGRWAECWGSGRLPFPLGAKPGWPLHAAGGAPGSAGTSGLGVSRVKCSSLQPALPTCGGCEYQQHLGLVGGHTLIFCRMTD